MCSVSSSWEAVTAAETWRLVEWPPLHRREAEVQRGAGTCPSPTARQQHYPPNLAISSQTSVPSARQPPPPFARQAGCCPGRGRFDVRPAFLSRHFGCAENSLERKQLGQHCPAFLVPQGHLTRLPHTGRLEKTELRSVPSGGQAVESRCPRAALPTEALGEGPS